MKFNIIYLYKESDWGKELKFSLRSVQKYVEHDTVFIAGDKPEYLTNVTHIECEHKQQRYEDANQKFKNALSQIPKDEPYILMHDDFFLLRDYEPIQYYNGKMKGAHVGGDRKVLFHNQGYEGDPNNYAIHYPMPFIYDFDWPYDKPVSLMNALGKMNQFPSREVKDCKYHPQKVPQGALDKLPCFSTYNEGDDFEDLLLKLYPEKSIFER